MHLGVVGLHGLLYERSTHGLLLGDGAVLVGEEQRLQIDDLFPQLSDLGCQVFIRRAVLLDLVLKIREPLFFPLPTFQCGDPKIDRSVSNQEIIFLTQS